MDSISGLPEGSKNPRLPDIKKNDANPEITDIFKQLKELSIKAREGREIAAVRKDRESDKRVKGAVFAFFDHIPSQKIAEWKGQYPNSVKQLFEVSQKVIEGKFGDKLKQAGLSLSETLIEADAVLNLLLLDLARKHKRAEDRETPEIFAKLKNSPAFAQLKDALGKMPDADFELVLRETGEPLSSQAVMVKKILASLKSELALEDSDKRSLVHIFRNFLENLANPSHIVVNMLLDNNMNQETIDKSLKTALSSKNTTERTKSLNSILNKLYSANKVGAAINFLRKITAKKERAKPLSNLIDKLLKTTHFEVEKLVDSEQVDEVIHMAEGMDADERDKLLQKIAIGLARNNHTKKSIDTTEAIKDPEIKAYTQSSVVNSLSNNGLFKDAIKIAFDIKEPGFKEDAIAYVVKGLLHHNQVKEAIDVVDKIQKTPEKVKAAKIIESSLLSTHNDELVKMVREKFDLIKTSR